MNKAVAAICAALLLAGAAGPASARTPAAGGHQGEAPPWSFACMKDSGPTECREPMWIYGN